MKITVQIDKRVLTALIVAAVVLCLLIVTTLVKKPQGLKEAKFWQFQSIDTMKYSRDLSREKLKDPTFDVVIERQIKQIADTGATHVGIATPYDKEFLPILRRWIKYARQYNLNVWFRGNFSGWEGWFGYSKIGRAEHIKLTEEFILENKELFKDGDVFSACPECENGGPGDPRLLNDASGHSKFLIDEHFLASNAFLKIGKKVDTRYNSMNGDVANLVMTPKTTSELGGIVAVDHYVNTPQKLFDDVGKYASKSGGKVVLGEFGAPIPDINGEMSELEQAEWLGEAMNLLLESNDIVGMNYWVNTGGSTELWEANGTKKEAVNVLTRIFNPYSVNGTVVDVFGRSIKNATISSTNRAVKSDEKGHFILPSVTEETLLRVSGEDFESLEVSVNSNSTTRVTLLKKDPNPIERLLKFLSDLNFPLFS